MSERFSFADLRMEIPRGWFDITNDLPVGTPPTLAREDGIGVLQFSVARYEGGRRPHVGTTDLRELLEDFARKQERTLACVGTGGGTVRFVVGDLPNESETLRVWYLTNGEDIALLTYIAQVAPNERVLAEIRDLDALVASLSFD